MKVMQDYATYHMLSAIYRLLSAITYRRLYTAKSDIRAHE